MLLLLFKTANICTRCIVHQMRLIVQWNCTIPIQRDYHEVSLDTHVTSSIAHFGADNCNA